MPLGMPREDRTATSFDTGAFRYAASPTGDKFPIAPINSST
jgi:hypothetical protein